MNKKIYWPLKDLNLSTVYGLQTPEPQAEIRRVLKLSDNGKEYALQLVGLSERRLFEFHQVIEYLATTEFNSYRKVHLSIDNLPYVPGDEGSYILSDWFEGRAANFRNYDDLISCAKTLGELHQKTKSKLPSANDWEERWKSTLAQYRRLDLSSSPKEIRQLVHGVTEAGQKALALLKNKEVYASLGQPAVLCHRNLSRNNLLINEHNECFLSGFEQARGDIPQTDLTQLITIVLRMNKGDTDLVLKVIAAYCHENPLASGDFGAMLAFLYFPRSLWGQCGGINLNIPMLVRHATGSVRDGLIYLATVDKLAQALGY